jgi:hypothetical protein
MGVPAILFGTIFAVVESGGKWAAARRRENEGKKTTKRNAAGG